MTATDPVKASVGAALKHVVNVRHELHQIPEVMFEEQRTSALVQRELKALGVEHRAGLAGGTGVLGFIPAKGSGASAPSAKTVALRADMDALPILEATGLPYASKTPGAMHACGHDGHTAILLGAARVLSGLPERRNNVLLVFQPAEEGGAGGEKMCIDGALNGTVLGRPADIIYGLHGWPDLPVGQVATRDGPLLAATDEFDVVIRGRGGHAAYPHMSIDPVVVASQVVLALQSIASRRVSPLDSVVVTVAGLNAGGAAHNVIPDEARLRGTIRTLRDDTRSMAEAEFRRIVTGVAASLGAVAEITWHIGYPVTRNEPGATERFRRIAREAIGAERVLERDQPSMGGEDFSFYGRHVPACFFFLGLRPDGAATYPGLHTPTFDFNDDALPTALELMCRLATEAV